MDSRAKTFILENHKPKAIHNDMQRRKADDLPAAKVLDLYTVGFPCQPWSRQNSSKLRAWKHPSSKVIVSLLETILLCLPAVIVLENVEGLLDFMTSFLRKLRSSGLTKQYIIAMLPLGPELFGLPTRRPRLYFVGIRVDVCAVPNSGVLAEASAKILNQVKAQSSPSTFEDVVGPLAPLRETRDAAGREGKWTLD